MNYPDPFLELRTTVIRDDALDAKGLCAGYEGNRWRGEKLAKHLFQWIPYVALDQENQAEFSIDNFMEKINLAARHIYKTKKTASRGEIGELILHIACVQEFGALPVLLKLALKTSSNDTVKGFDGVHFVTIGDGDFEIWLGESKFYSKPHKAIDDAVNSIEEHLGSEFLDTEKAMIYGHIPDHIPNREVVRRLFRDTVSTDVLIRKAVFPVLIAYNSSEVPKYTELCDQYSTALESELKGLTDRFYSKFKQPLKIQLIFVPMANKTTVIEKFDQLLEAHT